MTAIYWEIGCSIVGSEQQGSSSRNTGRSLLGNSPKIWSHVLAGLWVAHLTQMRAFILALPALKILQTLSAKSVPLPKLQARHFGTNTWRADKPQNPEQSRINYELILSEIPFLAADSPAITKVGTWIFGTSDEMSSWSMVRLGRDSFFFVSLDDQIARISRMKASIFFVIRARSGPRFCSRQIPLKNVMTRPASESLSSRAPRAASRLSMSS